MVEINIDLNVKDLPKDKSSEIAINEDSLKESAQNPNDIQSPELAINERFRDKSNSNKAPIEESTKSDSDSLEKDLPIALKKTKSESSGEWCIKRYLPKGFKRTPTERKDPSICRLIRFDCNVLNSCTAYSQIFILSTSLVIILIIVLGECFQREKSDDLSFGADPNQSLEMTNETKIETNGTTITTNETIITTNRTTITTRETTVAIETTTRLELTATRCLVQLYFLIVCIITANIEILTLLLYLFHLVEALPNVPWLPMECFFYSIGCLHFLVLSIWVAFYGNWLTMASVLGIINSLLTFILALIKFKKCELGEPAQHRSDDPDGNLFRRLSPNLKFKKTNQNSLEETYVMKRTESLESL
jgi:hypothetical protein